jgi:hypothetical protein
MFLDRGVLSRMLQELQIWIAGGDSPLEVPLADILSALGEERG